MCVCVCVCVCVGGWLVECSSMAKETEFQSQIEPYQRYKIWYLMPPFLTLTITRYGQG